MMADLGNHFAAAGELLFGRWFKSPLARLLNRDRNMLRKYATGKARIRPSLAAEIRATVNIGPVGRAIRNTIKNSMPEIPTFTAVGRNNSVRGASA
jgi:hypothetical protein